MLCGGGGNLGGEKERERSELGNRRQMDYLTCAWIEQDSSINLGSPFSSPQWNLKMLSAHVV